MLDIAYMSDDVIVVCKPAGMPSQPDPSGDVDAMTACSEQLRDMGKDTHLWLVHRLDRVVGGAIAFARTRQCASELSSGIADGSFTKLYYAVVGGKAEGGRLVDLLYKDSSAGKSFVVKTERKGVKKATLDYIPLAVRETEGGAVTLIAVRLHSGRFHQIRAQMAYHGFPLLGDKKYGSRDREAKFPALFSSHLGFEVGGRTVSADLMPDLDLYPWSLFDRVDYEGISLLLEDGVLYD